MRDEIKNLMEETRKLIEESEDFIFENYKGSYILFNSEMEDVKENLALIENSIDSIPDDQLERVKENLNVIKESTLNIKDNYDSKNLSTTSATQESIDVNAYLDSIENIEEQPIVEAAPGEETTEVLPTDFVQPYVEEAKADVAPVEEVQTVEQPAPVDVPTIEPVVEAQPTEPVQTLETTPDQLNVVAPEPTLVTAEESVPTIDTLSQTVEQPQVIMPTGSIDLNTLDNITANITAIPEEQSTPAPETAQPVAQEPVIDPASIAFQSQPEDGINVAELDDLFNS